MKLLYRLIFKKGKYHSLLVAAIFSMILVTVASQLEILSIGVITRKGPDFFELFSPVKDGYLQKSDAVTKDMIEQRWYAIAQSDTVTKKDAMRYLIRVRSHDKMQQVVNTINEYINISENLTNLAILLVCIALFKAITLFTHRFITKVVSIRVSHDLRQEYFEHIQKMPMSFFQTYEIGSLSARVVGDATLIGGAVNACLTNYIQTPFTVLTTLLLCFYTSWQLSLLVFLGFPAVIIPIVFISNRVRCIAKQLQQNQERFTSVLIEFLSGIQTIKMFAMENFSLKKYREHNLEMAKLEKKSARYDLSSRPVVHTIGMSCLSVSLLWGLYFLQMSVSEIFFFCGLLYIFYEPVKKFAEENAHIQRGIAAAERMDEVLVIKPGMSDEENAVPLNHFTGPIEFNNVGFRYGDTWILRNLSFTINKGESVAIVGPTGAGKSTIVQLLPRLYDVQEGEIRINGQSIKRLTQRSLREMIAFVPQKPFLFLDTICANISYGKDFTDQEVENAAIQANADEFIQKFPERYQTRLLEMGKNLSGGQQQRLAIARALVKKAPILVMDEATSSLDNISECNIKEAINEFRGKVTQIIIAHRLSTIEGVDRIIYIENGRKIAEGTRGELLRTCPPFINMWRAMQESVVEGMRQ